MRNVFQISAARDSRSNAFTGAEKTQLGDIAMEFRDEGIPARLFINPNSITPLARFINAKTGEHYLYISRHRDNGVIEYKISPRSHEGLNTLNFSKALIFCRNYLEALNAASAAAWNMQEYRQG